MARARTIVLWVLTAEVVVLLLTGVALYFWYRPEPAAAWSDVYGAGTGLAREARMAHLAQLTHRWAAWLAVPTAITAAVLLAVRAKPTERVGPGLATGIGVVVAVVAASITGYLLPWDQLALWAVTVGTNISGYTWLRDGSVRFVLMGNTEIAPTTVFKWLLVHAVVLGGAVIGLLCLAWRRTCRQDPELVADGAVDQLPPEVRVGA